MGIYQSFTNCKYFQIEGSYMQCIGCDMVECPKYKRIIYSEKNDPVNRPAHYTDGKIEVIEYIEDKKLGFCLGNAIKYISRAGKKDPTKEVEDLKKAIWYIDRRIKEITISKPTVITLCGSTKFKKEFEKVQKQLTLKGYIVISVGLFGHCGDKEAFEGLNKKMLDDLHKRKIDLSDEIFVINKNGYIGDSTKSEIDYALKTGKKIRYMEGVDNK